MPANFVDMVTNAEICLSEAISEISINGVKLLDQRNLGMSFENDSTFIAVLTTIGRVTGKEHAKMLKAVKHNDRIYFSRHKPDSDWFKNILKNSNVIVELGEQKFQGDAKPVKDEKLSQKISELKYPGEERAREKRVTIEVTLYEQQ